MRERERERESQTNDVVYITEVVYENLCVVRYGMVSAHIDELFIAAPPCTIVGTAKGKENTSRDMVCLVEALSVDFEL